jgi:hypothetical protein
MPTKDSTYGTLDAKTLAQARVRLSASATLTMLKRIGEMQYTAS